MARTDFEDSAFTEGLVSGVMARMGASVARAPLSFMEFAACGMLLLLWKDTQRALFVSGSRSELMRLIGARYPSSEDAERFIDTCLANGSIFVNEESELEVTGNKKHVARLRILRASASRGGQARQTAGHRLADGRFAAGDTPAEQPSNSQATTKQSPALLTPYSLLDLQEGGGGNADSDLRANPAALALEKLYIETRKLGLVRLPPAELVALDELLRVCKDPRAALVHYLADTREYYTKRKWKIQDLVADIGQHTEEAPAAPKKRKNYMERTPEEQAAHEAEVRKYQEMDGLI